MKNRIATIFIFLFSVVAFLPLLQQAFHPIKLAGLQGAFDGGVQPVLSFPGWVDGTFQSGTDQYLKYNTAFNGELVRLRNQLEYSVFGNINTILTLGKENYIYDPNYILSIEGGNLVNSWLRANKDEAFAGSMAILDSLQIPLLVIFAPNKASYFPEYLPAKAAPANYTNKKHFMKLVRSYNSYLMDCDKWFVEMKSSALFPLIPKYGAHWSTYGASIASDSLLRMVGKLIGKPCTSFEVTAIETTSAARFTDDDYLASLNLMQKFQSPVMAYPQLVFNKGYKPNVLIVSDSFIWNLYDLEIVQNSFDERSSLWYYQKTAYDIYKNNKGPLPGKISGSDLAGRELVILLVSDPGLTDFGYGFFEQLSALR